MPEESTTPDSVERIRRGVEAFNRRDFDAVMSFYSPDVVWDTPVRPSGSVGTLEGVAALRRFWEEWVAPYEELTSRWRKSLISITDRLCCQPPDGPSDRKPGPH